MCITPCLCACMHGCATPNDFRAAVERVIELGGDSDTTGAIVGALAGAAGGEAQIPTEWLSIADFPRSLGWIRSLAGRLHERSAPMRLWWPLVPARNAMFLAIVVITAVRRLLPPY